MFDRIISLLTGPEPDPDIAVDQTMVAVAALLVEAARMDDQFEAAERDAILSVLSARFGLSDGDTEHLLSVAERAEEQTAQLFRFTHLLVTRLEPPQRVPIVEMLWQVAYADGSLSPEEDSLIRRVAGLLYVSDRDRGLARQRAMRRLGLED